MGKKVRSALGVEVDFDILRIKQEIASAPSVDVSAREDFVEKRLRRRQKRSTVATKAPLDKAPEVPAEPVEEPVEQAEETPSPAAEEPAEEPVTVRPTKRKTQ